MRNARANTDLFTSLFSLYRDVRAAAEVLTAGAARAHAARDYEKVDCYSERLLSLELSPACASIARYYQAIAKLKGGAGDLDASEVLLELAKPAAPVSLLKRISLTQSFIAYYKGDTDTHLRLCEILMKSSDVMVAVEAGQSIAVVIGIEGEHKRSLELLEALYPVIENIGTYPVYFNFHNSLAEEYKHAGRLDDAKKASSVATASPLARVWGEFGKTAKDIDDELAARQRGSLVVGPWKQGFNEPERISQVWRIKAVTGNSRLSANDLRIYADAGEAALWG